MPFRVVGVQAVRCRCEGFSDAGVQCQVCKDRRMQASMVDRRLMNRGMEGKEDRSETMVDGRVLDRVIRTRRQESE